MKFHEFQEISRISWFYEKMLNSWNSAFSSRSGSQNASFLLAKQSYSACWAMQVTISCNFMEIYEILWNFIKLKKKWKCWFSKISIKFTKMRRGLKTTTRCNGFLVVLRQRSVRYGFTPQNAKFSSFCYFFMKWAHFS